MSFDAAYEFDAPKFVNLDQLADILGTSPIDWFSHTHWEHEKAKIKVRKRDLHNDSPPMYSKKTNVDKKKKRINISPLTIVTDPYHGSYHKIYQEKKKCFQTKLDFPFSDPLIPKQSISKFESHRPSSTSSSKVLTTFEGWKVEKMTQEQSFYQNLTKQEEFSSFVFPKKKTL